MITIILVAQQEVGLGAHCYRPSMISTQFIGEVKILMKEKTMSDYK